MDMTGMTWEKYKNAEARTKLRDDFAKAAMQGLISSRDNFERFSVTARAAYRMADAMLLERTAHEDTTD